MILKFEYISNYLTLIIISYVLRVNTQSLISCKTTLSALINPADFITSATASCLVFIISQT